MPYRVAILLAVVLHAVVLKGAAVVASGRNGRSRIGGSSDARHL